MAFLAFKIGIGQFVPLASIVRSATVRPSLREHIVIFEFLHKWWERSCQQAWKREFAEMGYRSTVARDVDNFIQFNFAILSGQ